jgi:molybdate transport system ATP-binding protein
MNKSGSSNYIKPFQTTSNNINISYHYPMIILENLSAGYTAQSVISNINWHIRPHEHWVVTGNTGAGKTALLHTLAGKTRILSGRIDFRFLHNSGSYEERKAAIRMISFTDTGPLFHNANAVHYYQQRYQAFDSGGYLTVRDYLEDGGLDQADPLHQELLDLLNLRALLPLERIKLSSGQTRKMLLCKAFLSRPKMILLDNPHIGLDDQSRRVFNDYIDHLVEYFDQQIIFSGHFRSLPKCMTHQLHLEKGYLKSAGKITEKIPEENAVDHLTPPSKQLINRFNKPVSPLFEFLLKFDKINIQYTDKKVFHDLDWEVKKGEKWVVQGANGSGKSTLISLIYGDHPQAYSNKIILFDRKRGTGESIWDLKKSIGFTSPELHSYFRYNHMAIDVVISGIWDGFFVRTREKDSLELARMLFEYFELTDKIHTPFQALSTGMQRLLFLMRALIKTPPVFLLDEPYQGLDRLSTAKSNKLLNLALTDQHTLIFISHFPDEVPQLVQHRLLLDG